MFVPCEAKGLLFGKRAWKPTRGYCVVDLFVYIVFVSKKNGNRVWAPSGVVFHVGVKLRWVGVYGKLRKIVFNVISWKYRSISEDLMLTLVS